MASILLIEPDTILAKTYVQALRQAGHRVARAVGAQPAISAAAKWRPELVVLELQLAGHNGLEFLYEFRSYGDWLKVPVLVHSIVPPQEFGQSAVLWQELAVTDYLYKPRTSLQSLLRAVENCLASAALA